MKEEQKGPYLGIHLISESNLKYVACPNVGYEGTNTERFINTVIFCCVTALIAKD